MLDSIKSYIDPPLILMIIGGLSTIFLGYWSSRYKKKSLPSWISQCTVCAGIVFLISGVWSSVDQTRFQRKLVALQTGEGSFAYAEITIAKNPAADYLQFDVIQRGEVPIYDLTIRITDQDYLKHLFYQAERNKIPLTLQYLAPAKRTYQLGTIGPVNNMISGVSSYLMPSGFSDRNFTVEVSSRYDRLNQYIHILRTPDGRLTFDNVVKRDDKIIYSMGNISYFERQVASLSKEKTNVKWTLKNQGESSTFVAIEGRWYAFDATGKLVNPEIDK